MTALSEYSNHIWNRFNWFMTIEVAAFGLVFSKFEDLNNTNLQIIGVPCILMASVWFLMGLEDSRSMRKHTHKAKEVERLVREEFAKGDLEFRFPEISKVSRFRQTWLLFILPLLVFLAWLLVMYLKG